MAVVQARQPPGQSGHGPVVLEPIVLPPEAALLGAPPPPPPPPAPAAPRPGTAPLRPLLQRLVGVSRKS
ncbi:hypothetical protein KUF71_013035, partial [Frankliniella fusca]